jgi:hypothetical protein
MAEEMTNQMMEQSNGQASPEAEENPEVWRSI